MTRLRNSLVRVYACLLLILSLFPQSSTATQEETTTRQEEEDGPNRSVYEEARAAIQMTNNGSLPELPEGLVWHQWPPEGEYFSDPTWYDTLGRDPFDQRKDFWSSTTPAEEQIEFVEHLLSDRPDRELDVLFKAAVKGSVHVVRYLLRDRGVKPIAGDEGDQTLVPLHAACFQGHVECAKLIHAAGVGVNHNDEVGGTPVIRATSGGHADIVKWLLDQGADPFATQEDGSTAIDYATLSGDVELFKLFLDYDGGKNLGVEGRDHAQRMKDSLASENAVYGAAMSGSVEMLEIILDRGGYLRAVELKEDNLLPDESATNRIKENLWKAFKGASSSGSVPMLRRMLGILDSLEEGGLQIHSHLNSDAWNELYFCVPIAAKNNHVDALGFLMENFFPSQPKDPDSKNVRTDIVNVALGVAAAAGSLETVQALVGKHSADVNCLLHPHFETPLYCTANAGKAEIVDFLLASGADIHQGSGRYSNGPTALHVAVRARNELLVNKLLEHGGPVEHIDPEITPDTTQVFVEARKEYRAPVRILKDHPAAVANADDGPFWIMLRYADGIPWLDGLQKRRPDAKLTSSLQELRKPTASSWSSWFRWSAWQR